MSVAMGIAHPRDSSPSAVRQEIDGSRDDHAADRRGDRQRRLARGRQFAGKRLAFDLQPDKEEEDRHEPVVDPLMHGERQRMPARGNGDRRRQQAVVGISPRRIGHDERGARAGDEQRSSGRFRSKELLERTR